MGSGSDTSEDYRKLEQAALAEAASADDPDSRRNLLNFARMWAEMARAEEQREGVKPDGPKPA